MGLLYSDTNGFVEDT